MKFNVGDLFQYKDTWTLFIVKKKNRELYQCYLMYDNGKFYKDHQEYEDNLTRWAYNHSIIRYYPVKNI